MKSNIEAYKEIRQELIDLDRKINSLINLIYGNKLEYLSLGTNMCSLLDIQLNIMKSYKEVLVARICLLREKMSKELD